MAIGVGIWIAVYVTGHHSLDQGSVWIAYGTALAAFGFGGYVIVRRLRRGPDN